MSNEKRMSRLKPDLRVEIVGEDRNSLSSSRSLVVVPSMEQDA